ncbi:MAG: ribosome maturation factor RimM [Gammaproteobacteria bacterium]|nr:ribosome maturation factor RimM [Gammaproteobacteria bacterium]
MTSKQAALFADRVVLGQVSGVFGIKGWLKIHSYTRPRENILDFATWFISTPQGIRRYKLRDGRPQGSGLVAQLDGVEDRDAAAALIGAEISVARSALPPTDPDEYYWSDLIGMAVVSSQGRDLGKVTGMLETGVHDVLQIDGEAGQTLIPFVQGVYVMQVDLDRKQVTVDWPE